MDKNKALVSGRIVRDPMVYPTKNGGKLVMFSIATGSSKKSADGGWEKGNTNYISCKAFGKVAEEIAATMKKGSPIEVTGPIVTGRYTNKNGVEVFTTDIKVTQFIGEQQQPAAQQQQQRGFSSLGPEFDAVAEPLYTEDSDVPF